MQLQQTQDPGIAAEVLCNQRRKIIIPVTTLAPEGSGRRPSLREEHTAPTHSHTLPVAQKPLWQLHKRDVQQRGSRLSARELSARDCYVPLTTDLDRSRDESHNSRFRPMASGWELGTPVHILPGWQFHPTLRGPCRLNDLHRLPPVAEGRIVDMARPLHAGYKGAVELIPSTLIGILHLGKRLKQR